MTPIHQRLVVTAMCVLTAAAVIAQQPSTPKPAVAVATDRATIDKAVVNFTLRDLMHEKKSGEPADAAMVSLSSFKDKKPVLLFFMSEQCSVTWRYEKRMGQLMQKYAKKDVAFFGVRCSANDTPQSICKFAESKNFVMPLLNDEKGKLSEYFHVTNTPSFALIDKSGVLRYFGSFDNAPDEQDVTKRYLADAVYAVLSDKPVLVNKTRPFG